MKTKIKEKLGIFDGGGVGMYLSLVGQSVTCWIIKDKVNSRLYGWYAWSLSQERNEIMLK